MNEAAISNERAPRFLRRDLRTNRIDGDRRVYRMVIDEVSGRFSRITENAWQRICQADCDNQPSEALLHQARAAGWTRERFEAPPVRFSPLAIRVPLGSIDWVAKRLARVSGVLFSPTAIVGWALLISVAMILVLTRLSESMAGIRLLPTYLKNANPFWIAATFLLTKLIHEMSHAVMCRRMGARSKSVGLFLFCGMPSPYCDVTDVWRLPSSVRRAAVMLAGIYVELIIATIATLVWVAANDPVTRMVAMNLMLVCGVSTLVFNANPLMRYDGYYVLMDLLGSTNLRREASESFMATVIAPIAGNCFGKARRRDRRAVVLSIYHASSMVYRALVLMAIAMFIVNLSAAVHIALLGVALVILISMMLMAKQTKNYIGLLRGKGPWAKVPLLRRFTIGSLIAALVAMILFVPLPRYREVSGVVDVAEATSVFLPTGSQIEKVEAEFGHWVEQGEWMATLNGEIEQIEISRLQGEVRLARLRSELARRDSLDRPEVAEQWTTLHAAEQSVETLLDKASERLEQTRVRAPEAGFVVPPKSQTISGDASVNVWLASSVGCVVHAGGRWSEAWCRIAKREKRAAVFLLDAKDHQWITVGTPIRVAVDHANDQVVESEVQAVSKIVSDETSVTRDAVYQVMCLLPASEEPILHSLGCHCTGVVRLPSRAFGADLVDWLSGFVSERI
ncbi:Peptidase family M50 [Planctomycetes bacterium CA13]|uniref:Peptidase family M50 n=1 Tax=Novipirellula herctigrandis TaxID=2527986 RepID=A0A5C5Z3T1_9BACT|nr:Peptidase family M50 [Planctomycetes bacterium CA13]